MLLLIGYYFLLLFQDLTIRFLRINKNIPVICYKHKLISVIFLLQSDMAVLLILLSNQVNRLSYLFFINKILTQKIYIVNVHIILLMNCETFCTFSNKL